MFYVPSVLLSQSHYYQYSNEDVIVSAISRVAKERFFRSIEILPVKSRLNQRTVDKVMKESGISLNIWITLLLRERNLNLASDSAKDRNRAIRFVLDMVEMSKDCGATYLSISSPPDVGEGARPNAINALSESLSRICEGSNGLRIGFEPFDRGVHKNGLIGPTNDFLPLIECIRERYDNFGLVWDSAHVALCGDDLVDSLVRSSHLLFGIHLANAVLERKHPLFGDNHIKLGQPGMLTLEIAGQLLSVLKNANGSNVLNPFVSVEVQSNPNEDPFETITYCRRVLEAAHKLCV